MQGMASTLVSLFEFIPPPARLFSIVLALRTAIELLAGAWVLAECVVRRGMREVVSLPGVRIDIVRGSL